MTAVYNYTGIDIYERHVAVVADRVKMAVLGNKKGSVNRPLGSLHMKQRLATCNFLGI